VEEEEREAAADAMIARLLLLSPLPLNEKGARIAAARDTRRHKHSRSGMAAI